MAKATKLFSGPRIGGFLIVLVLMALLAPAGASAQTRIGFDELANRDLVSDQYRDRGVRFGSAQSIGFPGPSPTPCGSPRVLRAPERSASPPNVAREAGCTAEASARGTLAAFTAPVHAVSLRGGVLGGTGSGLFRLTAYDRSGQALGSSAAAVGSSATTPVSLSDRDGRIAFMMLSVSESGAGAVMFDDLSFETPPPAAAVRTLGPRAGFPGLVSFASPIIRLSGPRSAARFLWDFGADGSTEASCNGTQSLLDARLRRPSGSTPLALTIVDSSGRRSTARTTFANVAVPFLNPSRRLPRFREPRDESFSCRRAPSDPVEDLTGGGGPPPACGQTILFGILEGIGCLERVPNVDDLPKADRDLFLLESYYAPHLSAFRKGVKASASGPEPGARLSSFRARGGTLKNIRAALRRSHGDFDRRANHQDPHIARGPVRINGLDVVPRNGAPVIFWPQREIVFSRDAEVKLGGISIRRGQIRLDVSAARGTAPLGDFDPARLPALGGFKGVGRVGIRMVHRGIEAKLRFELPKPLSFAGGQAPTGEITATATNARSLALDDSFLKVPKALIGPLDVRDVELRYTRASETWKGRFFVRFFPGGPAIDARPPPDEYGIRFVRGRFESAGAGLVFGRARPQIFPGVFLEELGAAVGLDPTRFRGAARISALGLVQVGGDALFAFPSPRAPYTLRDAGRFGGLRPLLNRTFTGTVAAMGGTVFLKPVPALGQLRLGSGYALYQYPSYVAAGGEVRFPIAGVADITGRLNGEVGRGGFNIDGHVSAGINVPTFARAAFGRRVGIGVNAIVSNKGVGACGRVPRVNLLFKKVGGRVGLGWNYRGLPDLYFFDNCDIGRYRARVSSGTASGTRSFQVARGTRGVNVRLEGRGGEPQVVLNGPRGERFAASEQEIGKGNMTMWELPETGRTFIGIRRPSAGRWTVTEQPGTPEITGFATAFALPPAKVTARVSGRGTRRTLRYRVRRRPGQNVTFVERGRETNKVLGRARRARGAIRFRPGDGPGGRRTIEAQITLNGVPNANRTVARYRAPRPITPRAPRLRVRRRGSALSLRWSRRPGVTRWVVVVSQRSGTRRVFTLNPRRRSLRVRRVSRTETGRVLVRGMGVRNLVGRPARKSFRARRRAKTRLAAPLSRRVLRRRR